MKATIDVGSLEEGEQIRSALNDPAVRAFVRIMSVLGPLKTQRAKERVLTFVKDHFEEMGAFDYVREAATRSTKDTRSKPNAVRAARRKRLS